MIADRVGAVVNPRAGGGNAAALFADLASRFPDANVDARITTGPDDVAAAAREQAEWADLVVSVGGDGTLREVAEAMVTAGTETPLFVVPAGRGNSTYRHLHGERDWREVVSALAEGFDGHPLDVGRVDADPAVDSTHFLLGFSAGLFRNALQNADRFRAFPGPLAYLLGTAQATLVDDPVDVAVEVDGEPFFDGAARLVAVGGGQYRGGDFELLPRSRPGDGRLHAVAVRPAGVRGSVRLVTLAREGRLLEHPAVESADGREVILRSERGLPVELDGTPIETPITTATLSVLPGALEFARPSAGRPASGSE